MSTESTEFEKVAPENSERVPLPLEKALERLTPERLFAKLDEAIERLNQRPTWQLSDDVIDDESIATIIATLEEASYGD